MTKIISFEYALNQSCEFKKRHLLLGNGFSIACKPDIFRYDRLLDQANFDAQPELEEVFRALGTYDFEEVIRGLEVTSKTLPVYLPSHEKSATKIAAHSSDLKDILIRTISSAHPENPGDLTEDQYGHCRKFLSHFLGPENKDGRVYTLNYDLLLYWALMHEEDPLLDNPIELVSNDGFGRDSDTAQEFVEWQGETGARDQRIHYLHGAIHLFDAGHQLQKFTWVNTGLPLIEQAQQALNSGKFPLFVAEGDSNQKLAKIKKSAYLYHSFKSFSSILNQRAGDNCLFIFGHSLAENDDHILKKIERGKTSTVFISIFGDAQSEPNQQIIKRANIMVSNRLEENPRSPLEVQYFDAQTAHVWG